jgi:hypothetical protein
LRSRGNQDGQAVVVEKQGLDHALPVSGGYRIAAVRNILRSLNNTPVWSRISSLISSIFQIPNNGKPLFTFLSSFGQVGRFLE